MLKRMIRLGFILLMCFVTSGCFVKNYTTTQETGKKLSDSTLQQLEPGKTTKEWTVSTLGTPSSRNKLVDGTEILKYEYSKKMNYPAASYGVSKN